ASVARGLVYATIYSEAHPDRQPLAAAIAALARPVANTDEPAKPGKRRGRPPRRSAELFDATAMPAPDKVRSPGTGST
ncbi:MAG: hypothetical protein H0X17_16790, partial [Deltaproteobacteria bacterium]|nr:hypothetical protein [Deltaproteobacteria bacterium]